MNKTPFVKNLFHLPALSVIALLVIAISASPMSSDGASATTTVPSIVVHENNMTLVGTRISGFEASSRVKVTFTVSNGTLTFDPLDASGVSISEGSNSGQNSISIQGTQMALNEAFEFVRLTACGTSLNLSASVMDPDQSAQFQANGHSYRWVIETNNLDWHEAKVAAAALTFDNSPSSQHGYLVTITTQEESDFVTSLVLGQRLAAWMGATDSYAEIFTINPQTQYQGQWNDSVLEPDYVWLDDPDNPGESLDPPDSAYINTIGSEGHWHWVTGPEAGTHFFDYQSASIGGFSNWAPNEPNNNWGVENAGMLRSDATWNDKYEYEGGQINAYVVEFGGMPGDPLPTSFVSNATYTRPFIDPCSTSPEPVLTVTAGAGGSASTSEYSDPTGDHHLIQIVPLQGYELSSFVVNGFETDISNNQFVLSNLMEDQTVHISFRELPVSAPNQVPDNGALAMTGQSPTIINWYFSTGVLAISSGVVLGALKRKKYRQV